MEPTINYSFSLTLAARLIIFLQANCYFRPNASCSLAWSLNVGSITLSKYYLHKSIALNTIRSIRLLNFVLINEKIEEGRVILSASCSSVGSITCISNGLNFAIDFCQAPPEFRLISSSLSTYSCGKHFFNKPAPDFQVIGQQTS